MYSGLLFLNVFAASRFSGDSQFGSDSIDMTETKMLSTVWIGSHRSDLSSYSYMSSPGGWRMDMHTSPVSRMFGWYIGQINFILGGMFGYSAGKSRIAGKIPPSYGVPGGPISVTRHLKMSLLMRPAEKPDDGSCIIIFSCFCSKTDAADAAIL